MGIIIFTMSTFSKTNYSNYENLVAYDCSHSTSPSCSGFDTSFYHSKTQSIVKDLNSSNTLFVRWDDKHTIISKVDLEEINKNNQTTSTKCQYQATASNAKCRSGVK